MNAANKENQAPIPACTMDVRLLSAWFDGEAGVRGHIVEAHVRNCSVCPQRLAQMRRAQGAVISALDKAMGPIEPLIGLQRIRERMVQRAERSWPKRLVGALHDLWLFQRPALAAFGLAAMLTVLAFGLWRVVGGAAPLVASGVVVESLHVESDAKTQVSASSDGRATLIWVATPTAVPVSAPEGTHGKR